MPSPSPLLPCSGPCDTVRDAVPLEDLELPPTARVRPSASTSGRANRTANRENLLLALLSRGRGPHLSMRSLTLSLFGALCDVRSKLTLACLCKGARHALEDRTVQAWLFSLHLMCPSYEGLGSFRGANGSWCIEKADAFNTMRLLDKEPSIGWCRNPSASSTMYAKLVARFGAMPLRTMVVERYGWRKLMLAFLREGCECCGKTSEKSYFNVFTCKQTCRSCWSEDGELCTVLYAQRRLNLGSKDFFFLPEDPSSLKIMKKIVVGPVISASGYKNSGTMTICSFKEAENYAISLHGSKDTIDSWYLGKLELQAERERARASKVPRKVDRFRPQRTSYKVDNLVNLIKENQALSSRAMLWNFKADLGLFYLPRLPRTSSEIKVIVTDLPLEQARCMRGCEGALIVTSNLYKGLLIATPTPVEGGHQFAIVAVGVAMHCCLDKMYKELSPRDLEELGKRSILFGESKTIHTVNTRLLGLPDDVGCVPVIRSSSGDVFANHLELFVSNVAFETGPGSNLVVEYGKECYQALDNVTWIVTTAKRALRLEMEMESG